LYLRDLEQEKGKLKRLVSILNQTSILLGRSPSNAYILWGKLCGRPIVESTIVNPNTV
jgi:hypothetical protein